MKKIKNNLTKIPKKVRIMNKACEHCCFGPTPAIGKSGCALVKKLEDHEPTRGFRCHCTEPGRGILDGGNFHETYCHNTYKRNPEKFKDCEIEWIDGAKADESYLEGLQVGDTVNFNVNLPVVKDGEYTGDNEYSDKTWACVKDGEIKA